MIGIADKIFPKLPFVRKMLRFVLMTPTINNGIDERQGKHRTYRYDYEPKREAQEAKIISAGEFVESENAKDKAAKTDESTAKEPETAVKIKPSAEEKPAEETKAEEKPADGKSAEEKPAENKPATAKKPRKTSAKKVDKPEGGDGKLE